MRRMTDGNMILPPISEVRAAGAEVLLQQVFRHWQTVRTVADRTEPPRGFCLQPLAAQAGRYRFDIEGLCPGAKFIRQAWHPIALSCDSYRLSWRAGGSDADTFSKLQGFLARLSDNNTHHSLYKQW